MGWDIQVVINLESNQEMEVGSTLTHWGKRGQSQSSLPWGLGEEGTHKGKGHGNLPTLNESPQWITTNGEAFFPAAPQF